jgi:hypothetical protein
MSREWKPGDVAMVRWLDGERTPVIVREVHGRTCAVWGVKDGTEGPFSFATSDVRPLAVIDPDSPADQRRLLGILRSSGAFRGVVSQDIALDCIGDALREFANPTPPKPDEPTGLGAVVEDAEGLIWIRGGANHQCGGDWHLLGATDYCAYAEIAAVEVLSDGVVTP